MWNAFLQSVGGLFNEIDSSIISNNLLLEMIVSSVGNTMMTHYVYIWAILIRLINYAQLYLW